MTEQRPISFTNDLDGVHFHAPIPINTAIELFTGKFRIPQERPLQPYEPRHGVGGRIFNIWSAFFHGIRPSKLSALEGLYWFEEIAEKHNRDLKKILLSGRDIETHAITSKRLVRSGYGDFIVDEVLLNESSSSLDWKVTKAREKVNQGNVLIHIDDDVKPALAIARIDEEFEDNRVLVYLMRNLSNREWLLRRSGNNLPANVVPVSNFQEAWEDFDRRLSENYF